MTGSIIRQDLWPEGCVHLLPRKLHGHPSPNITKASLCCFHQFHYGQLHKALNERRLSPRAKSNLPELQDATPTSYGQGLQSRQTNREAIRPLQNVSKVELADVWSENGSTYGPKSHTALAPQHWPSSIQIQTVMYPDHIPR
jgi:hypothetical protein